MKRTKTWIIGAIIIIAVVVLCANVFIMRKLINTYTYAEMDKRGYASEEIAQIQIDHSYMRRILGYNEWRISVEFEKEPSVFFWFSYRNNQILFEGVSSEPMLNKEAVIAYSELFKSGTLLDEPPEDEEKDKIIPELPANETAVLEEPLEEMEMGPYSFEIISNEENASVKAVLSCFDEEDRLVWEYQTEEVYVTELDVIQNIGFLFDGYCFIAGGKIYCIELKGENAGTPRWVNEDFQGASACWAIEDKYGLYNVIYLSGYYGPDLMVVDSRSGETMLRQDKLELKGDASDYVWPGSISLDKDAVKIDFEFNEKSVYVNPKTGEVLRVE